MLAFVLAKGSAPWCKGNGSEYATIVAFVGLGRGVALGNEDASMDVNPVVLVIARGMAAAAGPCAVIVARSGFESMAFTAVGIPTTVISDPPW